MINSICIVRLSALGDVLMLVPLVRTLQEQYPQAKITWVISRPAYFLVEGMDGVEFIVIDKPKSIRDYWSFWKMMQSRHFDVLLAPQASLRTNLLYPLISAQRKIGYDSHRAKDAHRLFIKEQIVFAQEHTLEGFVKFAEPLGIEQNSIRWDLPIQQEDYDWADAHLPHSERILVVNPAASKPERSWLTSRYIDVIKEAQKRWGVQIVLTGGPGSYDRALADEMLNEIVAIDLVGKTKPKQLLAVISRARGVLCPDTGPSHMAAAVNTPVVALHAVTNPDISGPYTFRPMAVNRYPDAIKQVLKKQVSEVRWGTQVHGNEAMQLIQVEDVLEKLALIFE